MNEWRGAEKYEGKERQNVPQDSHPKCCKWWYAILISVMLLYQALRKSFIICIAHEHTLFLLSNMCVCVCVCMCALSHLYLAWKLNCSLNSLDSTWLFNSLCSETDIIAGAKNSAQRDLFFTFSFFLPFLFCLFVHIVPCLLFCDFVLLYFYFLGHVPNVLFKISE